jgi:hypothetical protein
MQKKKQKQTVLNIDMAIYSDFFSNTLKIHKKVASHNLTKKQGFYKGVLSRNFTAK